MAEQKNQEPTGLNNGSYLIPPGTIIFPMDEEWKQEGCAGETLLDFLRPPLQPLHEHASFEPRYSRIVQTDDCLYVNHGETYDAKKITYLVIAVQGDDMFWMQYTEIRFVEDGETYVVQQSYTHHPCYTNN